MPKMKLYSLCSCMDCLLMLINILLAHYLALIWTDWIANSVTCGLSREACTSSFLSLIVWFLMKIGILLVTSSFRLFHRLLEIYSNI
uniref:Uncharacterized protein n=1 Tax=Arundo donax TaxID=35708 RepID=A0A0A9DDN6_ARUDO